MQSIIIFFTHAVYNSNNCIHMTICYCIYNVILYYIACNIVINILHAMYNSNNYILPINTAS